MEKVNKQYYWMFSHASVSHLQGNISIGTHFKIGQGLSVCNSNTCMHRLQKKKCIESKGGRNGTKSVFFLRI